METKRYVRTRSNYIIDLQNTDPFMIVNDYIDFNSGGRFQILSTSDDLTELCDKFIVDRNDGTAPFLCDPYDRPICKTEEDDVYGAIWTRYGLIYVAKMNDKAEFELMK